MDDSRPFKFGNKEWESAEAFVQTYWRSIIGVYDRRSFSDVNKVAQFAESMGLNEKSFLDELEKRCKDPAFNKLFVAGRVSIAKFKPKSGPHKLARKVPSKPKIPKRRL